MPSCCLAPLASGGRVLVYADGGVDDEGWCRTSRRFRPGPERGEGDVAEVLEGADPADGPVRLGATHLKRPLPQGRGHYGHVHGLRQCGVGRVVTPVEVYGTLLKEPFEDPDILGQVSQGRAEVGAEGGLHALLVAWADPEAEPARRQIRNDPHLLGQGHRVPRPCLDDRGAQQDALGPCRGRGGNGEGVAPRAAGGHPGRPHAKILGHLDGLERAGGVSSSNGDTNGPLAHDCDLLGGVE